MRLCGVRLMQRAITASMIWSGMPVASSEAGVAMAASWRSFARTAGHSRCPRSRGSAVATRPRQTVHRSRNRLYGSPRRWVHRQQTLCANVIAQIVARQITIEREEPYRRTFRRDAGGWGRGGSDWHRTQSHRFRRCQSPAGSAVRRRKLVTNVDHAQKQPGACSRTFLTSSEICSRPMGNAGGTSARTPSTVLPQRYNINPIVRLLAPNSP